MWIAGVWNPLSEFPDLLQVLQEKVRQNVIWGYENARLRPGIFDLRPKRNPAPSGAAFFYPRRYAAAPRGCRGKTPGLPPVGFAFRKKFDSRSNYGTDGKVFPVFSAQ